MKTLKPALQEFEVEIDKVVYGGLGLARHRGQVIFVPLAAPGDHLLVRPVEQKKHFICAEIVSLLSPGKGRATPRCPYFGRCGGCQWQHLDYPTQVELKRQILEQIFHHRLPETKKLPIRMKACAQPYEYRSRTRLQVRRLKAGLRLGFYRRQSHLVEDVKNCPLLRPTLNEALTSIREAVAQDRWNLDAKELALVCSEDPECWRVSRAGLDLDEGFSDPEAINHNGGQGILHRRVGQFTFLVSPSVFFQVNDFLVADLLDTVVDLAESCKREAALDLFSGVGLFSLPLARQFQRVVAVENSPLACRLCAENASAAGIQNLRIANADVSAWMKAVGSVSVPAYDLMVLDPPRVGAGLDVMRRIEEWAPETVIHVSCDPQTLARDLAPLSRRGYRIDFVMGLDLFPQTYHFETVVRLKRRQ